LGAVNITTEGLVLIVSMGMDVIQDLRMIMCRGSPYDEVPGVGRQTRQERVSGESGGKTSIERLPEKAT